MTDFYKNEDEIRAVVRGFEECTTGKEAFSHHSHLTVATFYLINSDPEEAFNRMCSGLHKFIEHHGVNPAKFNGPLTQAWMDKIQLVVVQTPGATSLLAITNTVIENLAGERIVLEK